jgi:hypothetical protein
MDIRHREDFALSVGEPSGSVDPLAFRAMPVTTWAVRNPFMAAVVTAGFIATQSRGATQLDSPQGPALFTAQGVAIAFQELMAMLPHDIGDFNLGAAHGSCSRLGGKVKASRGLGVVLKSGLATWR